MARSISPCTSEPTAFAATLQALVIARALLRPCALMKSLSKPRSGAPPYCSQSVTSFSREIPPESGLALPTQHGLVNQLTLTLPDLDVDVVSPNAVSIVREIASTNTTVAKLVLAPETEAWIGWKPRSRDVKRETAVFCTELFQLYAPAAGVIEGVHQVQIRPAQGELSVLAFDVPVGATITDVFGNVFQHHRLDELHAMIKKVFLPVNDRLDNLVDRLPTVLDVAQEVDC